MGTLIYLSGAPATGKTTLCQHMQCTVPNLEHIAYRDLLMAEIADRSAQLTVENLRQAPSQAITRADVNATDRKLIDLVGELRKSKHVLVDSHPVSKEPYGFRATPFTPAQISALDPDVIICLYTDPEENARRIRANAEGRPLPSEFELSMHAMLQATIVTQYAYALGKACHLINSGVPTETLAATVCRIAKIAS